MKKLIMKYKKECLLILYWVIYFIILAIIKDYWLFAILYLTSGILYTLFRKMVRRNDTFKLNLNASFKAFILFSGFIILYSFTMKDHIEDIVNSPELISRKVSSDKVLALNHFDIYINESDGKAYIYYKLNGVFGPRFSEMDNLILSDESEQSLRYSTFYTLEDNVEVAFPTYKNELITEYLFKIKHMDNEYMVKSYVPSDNYLFLLKKAGFKKALDINLRNGIKQYIYLNTATKEAAISNGDFIIVSPYVEVPYDKEDYFTYRYEIFENNIIDVSKTIKDVEVSLLDTYSVVSEDIKRVSFYSEGTELSPIYGLTEIIFDDFAYVFRTGQIDADSIESIERFQ